MPGFVGRTALALAALLILVPAGSAQTAAMTSTPTTLFVHLISVQDSPINTQEPADDWTVNVGYGMASTTLTCAGPVVGNTGGAETEYHTYRAYDSPRNVDYQAIVNGVPRTAPERGLQADVHLNESAPMTLYWYLRSGSSGQAADSGSQVPAVAPSIVVRATLRAGDAISVDDAAYDAGEVIAVGETIPATLGPQGAVGPNGSPHTQVRLIDSPAGQIFEFAVPVEGQADIIPLATGFNLRVDLFMQNSYCSDPGGEGSMMPNIGEAHSSPGLRPRLELAVDNPLLDDGLEMVRVDGGMSFFARPASPWGKDDLDVKSLRMEIVGPVNADLSSTLITTVANCHCYDAASQPPMEWRWAHNETPPAGHYKAILSFSNLQGTASQSSTLEFDVAASSEMPGPAVPLILVALAGLAFAARRRR